ncbi:MAG: hypothetical protein OXH65_03755 [Paracoccaceae bacterium]|nr:hypothetical protein [Paracoccaceae bacterium]
MQTQTEMNTLPGLEVQEIPIPENGDPNLVDVARLSLILGISTARISQLTKKGHFRPERHGKKYYYDLPACVQSYIRFKLEGNLIEDDYKPSELLALEKTKMARLHRKEKEKNLVSTDEVRDAWNTRLLQIRQTMLSVPSRVGETDPALELHQIDNIDRIIRETLIEETHGYQDKADFR